MTTLSPTKARANLTSWLKAASEGQDVGILYGEHVIALRPVTVESSDYALREYGATADDVARLAAKANEEITKDRKAGRLRRFTGDIEELLAD
jgi:antitoxin (DNA-binding transcriptional repressor) of toxin-antitoxin stability system